MGDFSFEAVHDSGLAVEARTNSIIRRQRKAADEKLTKV
jgi:hypothetical protein